MMPAELKSLYRCLLIRGDKIESFTQEKPNEYHVVVNSNVLHTVGPLKGQLRGHLFFIQLSPILTGDDWNNDPSK